MNLGLIQSYSGEGDSILGGRREGLGSRRSSSYAVRERGGRFWSVDPALYPKAG